MGLVLFFTPLFLSLPFFLSFFSFFLLVYSCFQPFLFSFSSFLSVSILLSNLIVFNLLNSLMSTYHYKCICVFKKMSKILNKKVQYKKVLQGLSAASLHLPSPC